MPRVARKRMAGRPATGGASRGGIGGMLAEMGRFRAQLVAQRDSLDQQISAMDGAIAAMGGSPAARRVGRPPAALRGPGRPAGGKAPRRGSLKEYILKALASGNVMAVRDITAGVLRLGFKSKNQTLAKSVGIALTELNGVRKVGRGKFRLA